MLRRTLQDQRAQLGDRHRSVAFTLFNLGVLAKLAGRDGEAETLLRESLAIRESRESLEPLLVAETLYELGQFAERGGRVDEAGTLYKRALDLRRTALPPTHEDVEAVRSALARLGIREGK